MSATGEEEEGEDLGCSFLLLLSPLLLLLLFTLLPETAVGVVVVRGVSGISILASVLVVSIATSPTKFWPYSYIHRPVDGPRE